MSGFEVAGSCTRGGEAVPDGLTDAVETDWELREMYVHEAIYGRTT